jgi:hypothetical protein
MFTIAPPWVSIHWLKAGNKKKEKKMFVSKE